MCAYLRHTRILLLPILTLFLLLLPFLPQPALAYPRFEKFIPNSAVFNPFLLEFAALGHRGEHVEDNLNLFGKGFEDVSLVWALLCAADTDNDGIPNGVELGDPGCNFTPGASIGPPLSDPLNEDSTPANPGYLGPPYPPDLIVAHGAMMIIAWAVFAPVGIGIATVYKKAESSFWFHAHRATLILTLVLTFVAFLLIVFTKEVEDGNGFPQRFSSAHTGTGFAVILLAVVQAASGIMRPKGGEIKSDSRLIWEFVHQWLGRAIFVTALAAISTGLQMGFASVENIAEYSNAPFAVSPFVVLLTLYVIFERDKGVMMPWDQPRGKRGIVSGSDA